MKRNEINDLRTKTVDELRKVLSDLRGEAAKISVEDFKTKGKNVNLMRNKKKDIARVLTFLSMKAAVAESSGESKEIINNG